MKKGIYLKETGVILSTLPYGDSGSIVKVFTAESGLMSYFAKNGPSAKGKLSPFEPFTLGEISYEEGNGSLALLREFKVSNYHLPIRESLERIEAAALMADALDKTQGPGLEAPDLFTLFCLYLKWLPQAKNPFTLAASFYLKTMKHEGVLHITPDCTGCGNPLGECLLCEGTALCTDCALEGTALEPEETQLVLLLTLAREFKDIKQEEISPRLLQALRLFFENTTQ
ncbi:DNA repair protein RecO [Estrella lausannensis]|uniref:DNA repair protein RecO n=1 Tax=Estrella lausannensis TaxID=483423 RepID=A0A0H5DQE4_9BACT|nr:DNA repair protein RecO [Estrella lausannensis]CRX37774.1 DNA repair protein RecO [Estrella lausannensis]